MSFTIILLGLTSEQPRAYYYLVSFQAIIFILSGIIMIFPSLKLIKTEAKPREEI